MILSHSLSLNPPEEGEGDPSASLGTPARSGCSSSGSSGGIAARVKIATTLQRCQAFDVFSFWLGK